jgi:hypothetical protein
VPEPQPAQTKQLKQMSTESPASKLKKIEWYAAHLMNEAVSKEKAGRTGDATVDYLQAADLLLLLAKGQQGYSAWKAYTDKAVSCQQRARALIAAKKQSDGEEG